MKKLLPSQPADTRNPIVRAVSGPERSQLAPLPNSKLEVETIATDLPRPSTILLGADATETHFKHLSLNSTEVIHLALHGYADLDYPDRSALIFASFSAALSAAFGVVATAGLGGFGVLHYLRRDNVLEQSRVIMLTASASEQDVRQAIGLGASSYLAKPLDLRLLVDRVHRALRRSPGIGLSQRAS